MYDFVTGFSDTDDIRYCAWCGSEIDEWFADGTAKCKSCGFQFAVIESEESTRVIDEEET